MNLRWFTAACLLTFVLSAAPADDDAATLLAKAGRVLQTFPSQSIIRSTDKRCNAIVAWGR